jgi:signal transduction histidine kinase
MVAAVLLVAEYVADDRLTEAQTVLGCGVAVVTGILVARRRRWPLLLPALVLVLVAARVVLPPGGDGVAWGVIGLIGAYSVAVDSDGVVAWVGLAVTVATGLVVMAHDGGSWNLAGILFYGGWFCLPWVAGRAIRRRRNRELRLEEHALVLDRAREEEARAAVVEERIRIARELHDVVGHALSVMVLQADGGRRLLDVDNDETRTALDTIERVGREALGEMRRLVALMRESEDAGALVPQPTVQRLDALVGEVRRAGVPVELEIVGDPTPLPAGVDLTLYRTAQEALTNVVKHAGGARVQVRLSYASSEVALEVADDGRGRRASGDPGYGLVGIQERVSLYGGTFAAGDDGGGYTVRAAIPYQAEP